METTACNLCGADLPRRLFRNFDLDISRCGGCGLVYAGPLRLSREETWHRYSPTYFHDEYLPSFGVTNGVVDLPAFDVRYARTLSTIRRGGQPGTLLEIGCGAGFFLKAAERDGWTVTGLEVMSAGVEFARTKLGLNVMPSAVEDAELPTAGFDVVVLIDVIEHLSNPKALVARVLTLLRPGGCLAISTPNIDSLTRFALGHDWAVLSPAEHLYYFNERTLETMLIGAGFTDVQFDRHYAGAGRYETLMPTHSFSPASFRTRAYTRLVDRLGARGLRLVQALGRADKLQVLACRPPS